MATMRNGNSGPAEAVDVQSNHASAAYSHLTLPDISSIKEKWFKVGPRG